jgi:hypothetical protein
MTPGLSPAEKFLRAHRRRSAPSEWVLQRAVVRWCEGYGRGFVRGRFFAIPNGAVLWNAREGKRLKATGLKPGVPDMCFFRRDGRVLFIELKNGELGRLSENQRVWMALLEENMIPIVVCRNLMQVIGTVTDFFMPEKTTQ